MERKLQELIDKYQRHLSQAESNLKRFELLNQRDTEAFRTQKTLKKVWELVLKDLLKFADINLNDYSKKTD